MANCSPKLQVASLHYKKALTITIILFLLTGAHAFADEEESIRIQEITREINKELKNPQLYNPQLYIERAELYRRTRQWTLAFEDYKRALSLNPELKNVNLDCGRMLLEADRPMEAVEYLDRFISFDPEHGDALLIRAKAFVLLNQHEKASRDFAEALKILSPNPENYIEYSKCLIVLGKRNEALAVLDEAMSTLGPIVTLQLNAIEIEISNSQYDSALKRLESISSQSPRKEKWTLMEGKILTSAGRYEEAYQAYTRALSEIESLPQFLRTTRATLDLEQQIRTLLAASPATPR